ncbi:putative zinc-binding metallopeptidase [Sphingobacterium daejeonense]|uniref:putative zinc-binding metallopeptidase n=1 Tax=Sphingobacterium daejeonense TaxID=371142 RepID=UPI0010FD286B
MKNYIISTVFFTILFFCSCSKEAALPTDPIVDQGGETWTAGKIDNYIRDEFIKTYNIEIKYKWSPFEINYNRTLVPPQEKRVIPVLTAVRDIWMKPYETVAGKRLLEKIFHLQIFIGGKCRIQQ